MTFSASKLWPGWLWRPSQRAALFSNHEFRCVRDPLPAPEDSEDSAWGDAGTPRTPSPSPQGPGARTQLSCVCGTHLPPTPPALCPRVTGTSLSTLSPLANCPPPHPGPHPLGIGCQASVLRGFEGREHQVPKRAQWEGRSHVLLFPPLMRPQLWPSHSVPLAPHPPGLAAVPSPHPHPTPRTGRQLCTADHPHSLHGPSLPAAPLEAGGFGRGNGWYCQAGGMQRQPEVF